MIKPILPSTRPVALIAVSAFTLIAGPVSAQKSAVEEAIEAATDAAEAAVEAVVDGDAKEQLSRNNSELIKQTEKARKERESAYKAAFEFTPSPALWKISDADSIVYIFAGNRGLSHQIKWESEAYTSALQSADTVYFETAHYDRGDRETRRRNEREAFRKLIRHDRDLVEERFDPGLFDQIKGDLKNDFMAIGDFMPTWLLITLIADTDRMFQPGRSNRSLDYRIIKSVTDRDLVIDGLEGPSHLIDILNAVDEEKQREWLNAFTRAEIAVDKPKKYKDRKRGPFGRIGPLTAQEHQGIIWAKGEPPEAQPFKPVGLNNLYDHIRANRMENWPVKIAGMLDEPGTSLVIVSQKYLYGENNLRDALRAKGHKLKRVK